MCLAIPGQILSIAGDTPERRTAKVSFGGAVREASLAFVPEAVPGDYVLVHAGFALSRLDETEAAATLAAFETLFESTNLAHPAGGAGAGPPLARHQ
ncbi:MAG: HypC/HybG/HupF family hydrogenase formation chaperone [Planctomycetota bacterium]